MNKDINKEISKAMKKLNLELIDIMSDDKARIMVAIMASETKTKRDVGQICGFSKRQMFRLVKKYDLQHMFPEELGNN